MIINNAKYCKDCFTDNDLYVFAIGYEHRSYYLYNQVISMFSNIQPMVFALNDYANYPHTLVKINELEERGTPIYCEGYCDNQKVQQKIIDRVRTLTQERESITVHIDYSSMPRSWYCKLPFLLEKIMRKQDRAYFWYSEGEYPPSYEEYPSAGIDAFSFFSGKPSLQVDKNRIHVLALGYDVIRSQAILSITDPDFLVACYAYKPDREGFLDNLKAVNEPIFSRSAITLALHLDDFSFMVSKLCDTANELLPTGDIILIPDGPKPLIFAMSLVPDILNKCGVTCLHVSRNNDHFKAVDVSPTGIVYGFSITI